MINANLAFLFLTVKFYGVIKIMDSFDAKNINLQFCGNYSEPDPLKMKKRTKSCFSFFQEDKHLE